MNCQICLKVKSSCPFFLLYLYTDFSLELFRFLLVERETKVASNRTALVYGSFSHRLRGRLIALSHPHHPTMPTQSQSYSQSQNHPTLEWSSLQDVFYRKSQIYTLSWGIQSDFLNYYSLATADSGGFIALLRTNNSNFTKVNLSTSLSRLKPQLQIYTQAGQLVESIPVS